MQAFVAFDPTAGCNPHTRARMGAVLSEQNPVPRYQEGPTGTPVRQLSHRTPLPCRVGPAVNHLVSQSVHISEGLDISGQPRVDVHVMPAIGMQRRSPPGAFSEEAGAAAKQRPWSGTAPGSEVNQLRRIRAAPSLKSLPFYPVDKDHIQAPRVGWHESD